MLRISSNTSRTQSVSLESDEKCCLYKRILTDNSSKKKRKLIQGESAEKSRLVLERLEIYHYGLDNFVETSNRGLIYAIYVMVS